jgi:hypothetical protein
MPLSWTFDPGAWPMISNRAVAEKLATGRTPCGK